MTTATAWSKSLTRDRIIRGYYFATPLFLLLEVVFSFDFRVSAYLSDPKWRLAYYSFCFLCMIAIAWKPAFTVMVGILESSINIIFLFVGAAVSWMFPFDVESTDDFEYLWSENPITIMSIVNFLLAGGILILCFRQQVNQLTRTRD